MSSNSSIDVLFSIREQFFTLVGEKLPHFWFTLFLELAFLLTLATAGCALLFYKASSRSATIQYGWVFFTFLVASLMPFHLVEIARREARAWVVAFAVFLCFSLTPVLPKYLVSERGRQQRAKKTIIVLILLLIVLNVFKH